MLGPFYQVSWGSLYPALRRLAKSGAVEKVAEPAVPRRTTKSARMAGTRETTLASGRRRTVYRITDVGEQLFTQMLEETAAVDAEHFTLRLAFFRYLRPETRLTLLERRRAYLQEKLAQFKTNLLTYRERMDSYALSLQNHDMATTESDIAWIEELITQERAPEIPRPKSTRA
jgi:DNA-binding PadR family transcriptional regulator